MPDPKIIGDDDIYIDPTPALHAGDVEGQVRKAALDRGLDPNLMTRMAKTESNLQPNALSIKGAIGPMQLMPKTAAGLGVDPNNTSENITGGVRYFDQLMKQFGGDPQKAVAAYNAGPRRIQDVLSGKKLLPTETHGYLRSIFGNEGMPTWAQLSPSAALTGPRPTGRVIGDEDLAQQQEENYNPNITNIPSWMQSIFNTQPKGMGGGIGFGGGLIDPKNPSAQHIANTLAGNFDIAGGMAGAKLGADFGPWGAAGLGVVGALAGRRFTQAYQDIFDPQKAPKTTQEARDQLFESGKNAILGEVQGAALRTAMPWAQNKLYAKLTGADVSKATDQAAIAALSRDNIPLGIGQDKAIQKWKAPDLKTLDEITDKYKPTQTPGLVRIGAAGERSAQQGASMWSGGISKAKLQSDIRSYYASQPTIPQDEKNAFATQFENFFKDMGENISLKDARDIKSRIDLKIPFNEQTEGKLAARKALRYFTNQHIAEAIPDLADRDKWIKAAGNLETKINAEELADRLKPKGKGAAMNRELAYRLSAATLGGATGYFGHSPIAGIASGLGVMAATGPTAPSRALNLLNSPYFQAASTIPTRAAPGQMQENLEAAPEVAGQGLDSLQRLLEAARSMKFPGGQ